MTAFERPPVRVLPPVPRASRWSDRRTAELWTSRALQHHEQEVRRAAARREPWIELRVPVPASAGHLLVRDGASVAERPVSCAVVRLDLSAAAPRVLASFPEDLPTWEDRWDLLQVLSPLAADAVEHWLDPRVAVEAVLTADPVRAATARQQWRTALRSTTDPRALVEQVSGHPVEPPEGTSWSAWAEWFERRLEGSPDAGVGSRSRLSPLREAPSLQRTGRFDPDVDLTTLVTDALDAAADSLDAWVRNFPRARRSRLVVDTGRPVGAVVTARPQVSVAAQHVALVVERDAHGAPVVLDAHPELPPPDRATGHPALAVAASAYLGPGLERLEAQPWPAQRALLTREPAGVLDDLVSEVEDLLGLGDDALRSAVAATGLAVLPVDLRGWLERLVWRRRTFPWTAGG